MSAHRFTRFALLFLLLSPLAPLAGAAQQQTISQDELNRKFAAWIRFDDAGQEYKGRPYVFLGDGDLELTIDVKPAMGESLLLLWGSKRDERKAILSLNGDTSTLTNKSLFTGGNPYDGFSQMVIPLQQKSLRGDRITATLSAPRDGARPAFLAAVALRTPYLSVARSGGDILDLFRQKAPASKITVKRLPAKSRRTPVDASKFLWNKPVPTAEAFPELRKLWDREPAPTLTDNAPLAEKFRQAERNARAAAEAFYRCHRFVQGWLAYCDPKSGLFPRNLTVSRDFWNGRDSAADNYPFMVLTAALTDRPLFAGKMLEILKTEARLTNRIGRLCDDFSFSRQGWRREQVQLDDIVFDNAEYVKDGLIPLTEWLGQSPWSERGVGIIEDLWKNAPIDTPVGKIPTLNFEVNGDLLQACSRLYWFTGERKFLDWAIRLGDYYLLGNNHPTRNMDRLGLSDHACEVINGLSELYVAVSVADPGKREAYRAPLHEIYDSILKYARNPDGLLYSSFDPKTGKHSEALCDTWGYDYDGFYTMWLLDGTAAYRDAVRQALGNLKGKYVGAPWGDKSADGFADSIEGAINLVNREPVPSALDWIDSQTRLMWARQHADGIIEGWHGDGNFARTSIMYALMKTQGVHAEPWRADVRLGAVRDGEGIALSLAADQPWSGRIIFDTPRHKTNMRLPLDYPRINQFPEWFTVEAGKKYEVLDVKSRQSEVQSSEKLLEGKPISLKAGEEMRIRVQPMK